MDAPEILHRLRACGWVIVDRPTRLLRLPHEIAERHPRLPGPFAAFIGALASCSDARGTTWFLCESDYAGTSESAFAWDAWERLSLDAAEGSPRLVARVRSFWDIHLPFLMSVADGYAFHAIRTAADGFGRVVAGREPEFEDASVVAESFEAFLSMWLVRAAASE